MEPEGDMACSRMFCRADCIQKYRVSTTRTLQLPFNLQHVPCVPAIVSAQDSFGTG
eukprot:COSAG02_NODE_9169_length_2304_cov_2.015420_2_plen_56_part_00